MKVANAISQPHWGMVDALAESSEVGQNLNWITRSEMGSGKEL